MSELTFVDTCASTNDLARAHTSPSGAYRAGVSVLAARPPDVGGSGAPGATSAESSSS